MKQPKAISNMRIGIMLVFSILLLSCSKEEPNDETSKSDMHYSFTHIMSNVLTCTNEGIDVFTPDPKAPVYYALVPADGGIYTFKVNEDAKYCVDYSDCWLHNKPITDIDIQILSVMEDTYDCKEIPLSQEDKDKHNMKIIAEYVNESIASGLKDFNCPLVKCHASKEEIIITIDQNINDKQRSIAITLGSGNECLGEDFAIDLIQDYRK